jgi:molybdate transport system substrate-binding protein
MPRVVLATDALQALTAEGYVIPETVRIFARSPTAIAVPAGAPRPPYLDEAAIKALVSDAKRIALSTGPSGKSIAQLLQRWDVAENSKRQIVLAPPGVPVARLLARGDADVGFQQLSELLGEPGIEIIGTVPPSLQPMTIFSCGIGRNAADVTAAQNFLVAFMSTDAAAVTIKRGGMEPAR